MLPDFVRSPSQSEFAMKNALVLEDTDGVRDMLVRLLSNAFPGIEITAVASIAQAKTAIHANTFELALLDINLPDGNGVTLVSDLRTRSPNTYCVMATIFDDDDNVFNALRAGAHGYLLKGEPEQELTARLKGIVAGDPPISPSIARRMLTYFCPPTPQKQVDLPNLSDREREVLTLVAKGLSRGEIATHLKIGATTVASHIGAVYRKLDISSRAEATVEAIRLGLLRA